MRESDRDRPNGKKKCSRKRRIDPETLRAAALRHLSRYDSSAENLRRVLDRRVMRARRRNEEVSGDPREAIARIIVAFQELGYLDDRRYAQSRIRRLRREGKSLRGIESDLRMKGVAAELIRNLIQEVLDAEPDAELQAAIAYARRRRLGPFRREASTREENFQRDLAALGRRGFTYSTAKRIVRAEDAASLFPD